MLLAQGEGRKLTVLSKSRPFSHDHNSFHHLLREEEGKCHGCSSCCVQTELRYWKISVSLLFCLPLPSSFSQHTGI